MPFHVLVFESINVVKESSHDFVTLFFIIGLYRLFIARLFLDIRLRHVVLFKRQFVLDKTIEYEFLELAFGL